MSQAQHHQSSDSARPASHRGWSVPILGLGLLFVCFAANHIAFHARLKRIQTASLLGSLVVRSETSSAGHSQIGIDETSLSKGGARLLLTFATLGAWSFDAQNPAPCPEAIQALSGREASCAGFMYPLEPGSKVRLFCLLRTTQTCCYGPRPQYSQYLFVEMKEPVKFERFAPVTVSGRFFVDPQPGQGFIYRMEGRSVASAAADEPEADAALVARKTGLPRFDFALLDEMARQSATNVPAALKAWDGKRVVMEGFVLNRQEVGSPRLVLAKTWWDGKAQGVPPTRYNAATVLLGDRRDMPPAWKQKGVFTGTLQVTMDPALWPSDGIIALRDAVQADRDARRGVPAGPSIPVGVEVLILIGFVLSWACPARLKRMVRQVWRPCQREIQP